jgi:hypothetical protein
VKDERKHSLKSLTGRDKNDYKRSNRNLPNSLTLAVEFSRSNKGQKSTVPAYILSSRLLSLGGIGQ